MPSLIVEWVDMETQQVQRRTLDAPVTIGRGPENTLVLTDQRISRQHAVIEASAGQVAVRDCSSRNGVLVNGHKTAYATLKSGDQLGLGGYVLTITINTPEPDVRKTTPLSISDATIALPSVRQPTNTVPE